MNNDGNDTADTSPTFKVLEEGANTLEREANARLAERQLQFINHLQAALKRIDNKSYGICRATGRLIPKERLRAVPHATLCVEEKKQPPMKSEHRWPAASLFFLRRMAEATLRQRSYSQ